MIRMANQPRKLEFNLPADLRLPIYRKKDDILRIRECEHEWKPSSILDVTVCDKCGHWKVKSWRDQGEI